MIGDTMPMSAFANSSFCDRKIRQQFRRPEIALAHARLLFVHAAFAYSIAWTAERPLSVDHLRQPDIRCHHPVERSMTAR
jgi:hypothetical protein